MKITKMRKEMKRVLQEVKADVCSCRGVEDMLRSFQPFFTDDDYQRMKCLQENKGTIATWDKFMDDLMRCGDEAFEKFRWQVKERNYFSSEFKEKFEKVCFQNFLNQKGVGEHDQSFGSEDDTSSTLTNNDLPLQETGIAKTRNCRSIDSNASWSSFEVEDEVSHYSLVDESRAKSRRERFGSSESGKGSTGSRDSFQGQPNAVTLEDRIELLPLQARRELSDVLNQDSIFGKDWRSVAEVLEMGNSVYKNIEKENEKMKHIFKWMQHNAMLIGHLFKIFQQIESKVCIRILAESGIIGIPEGSYKPQNFDRLFSVEESVKEEPSLQEPIKAEASPIQDSDIQKGFTIESTMDKKTTFLRDDYKVMEQKFEEGLMIRDSISHQDSGSELNAALSGCKRETVPNSMLSKQSIIKTTEGMVLPIDRTWKNNAKSPSASIEGAQCIDADTTTCRSIPSIGDLHDSDFGKVVDEGSDVEVFDEDTPKTKQHICQPCKEADQQKTDTETDTRMKLVKHTEQTDRQTEEQETYKSLKEKNSRQTFDSMEVTGKLFSTGRISSITSDTETTRGKMDGLTSTGNPFGTSPLKSYKQATEGSYGPPLDSDMKKCGPRGAESQKSDPDGEIRLRRRMTGKDTTLHEAMDCADTRSERGMKTEEAEFPKIVNFEKAEIKSTNYAGAERNQRENKAEIRSTNYAGAERNQRKNKAEIKSTNYAGAERNRRENKVPWYEELTWMILDYLGWGRNPMIPETGSLTVPQDNSMCNSRGKNASRS